MNHQVCRAPIRRGVASRLGTRLPEPDTAPWGRTNRRIGLRQAWTLTPRLLSYFVAACLREEGAGAVWNAYDLPQSLPSARAYDSFRKSCIIQGK